MPGHKGSAIYRRFGYDVFLQKMMESTSPSYLLMGSLDINAAILNEHQATLMAEWHENLMHFYREAPTVKGLWVLGRPFQKKLSVFI